MPTTSDYYQQLVQEKHAALNSSIEQLIHTMAGEDVPAKKNAAGHTKSSVQDLRSVLAQQLVPSWLSKALGHLDSYLSGQWNAPTFLYHFLDIRHKVLEHTWDFTDPEASQKAFDFDAIFEHYKAASRVPQLFGDVLDALVKIQQSGYVDSVAMLSALQRIVDTIAKAKSGSYFSMDGGWQFCKKLFENYLYAQLETIPVLGPLVQALKDTINDTDAEIDKLRSDMRVEITKAVEAEVSKLQHRSAVLPAGYTRTGEAKPGEVQPAISHKA
jgi:hypothetical protein